MRNFEDYKKDAFKKDPELKKAYDDLELEFSIIEQLIRKRFDNKMTQGELARKAGTTQSAIARLENGNINPTVGFLDKISKAFGGKLQVSI